MSAMAKAQKGKGDAFAKEAEALLNKKGWFGSKTKNAEDAAETYEQAANAYKVGGLNHEAGDCYLKAAAIYRDTLSDFNSASKALNNAGASQLFVSSVVSKCIPRSLTTCIS
jgi:Soluble NSF attachment protein, SNAP